MIRPVRITVFLSATVLAVLAATTLLERHRDRSWTLTVDPVAELKTLVSEQRWAEARLLAGFVQDNPHLGDARAAARVTRRADAELDAFWAPARRFVHGAVTGEPNDGASLLGSLSLDLFVIGDIRDLAVQGWKQMRHGDGDPVILALSAVGLTTTLAPHLDWAPALLKTFRRSGALTRGFLRSLGEASRRALAGGRFGPLRGMANDIGRAARHLGPGPLRGAMTTVDNATDLRRVSQAAAINPAGTYAVTRLFGKAGTRRISRDGRNINVLVASMKGGSRLGKIASKTLGSLPDRWLMVILLAALALAASALPRAWRGRRSPARREPRLPRARHRLPARAVET